MSVTKHAYLPAVLQVLLAPSMTLVFVVKINPYCRLDRLIGNSSDAGYDLPSTLVSLPQLNGTALRPPFKFPLLQNFFRLRQNKL